MVVATLAFGLACRYGVTAKLGLQSDQARSIHVTLGVGSVIAIALHVIAIYLGGSLVVPIARLLVPFVWQGSYATAIAAGVAALWLIVIFGLTGTVARQGRAHRYWRKAHWLAAVGGALAFLHSAVLAGWI
jgi:DMSO/TMAO reductase YedYZ heme-binding membrane subunit